VLFNARFRKYISGNDWEKEFLLKLSDEFNPIIPILNDIFRGKEIFNRDFIYRIRPQVYE
jgi:hypothetical protein